MIHVDRHGPVIAIRMARRFLGKPLYWCAAYWVDGLLIDSGPAVTAHELLRVVAQVPVEQIAITHAHEDHIGGLAALRDRYPQARIYASSCAVPLIADPTQLKMQLYRRLVWGTPDPVNGVTPLDEVEDQIRSANYLFRAVETPGHSRDHVVYFEPNHRWVFSGDAFIGGRDRTWACEFDLFGVIGTLQTLVSLDAERLFPGSGNVRSTPAADIRDKINYLSQLAREVGRLAESGMNSAAIAAQLFPKESNLSFWTQSHYSAIHLVDACLSYNSLFVPQAESPALPGGRPTESPGTTRPSTKRSTDPGDIIR
jgi:glyoxylase-like metal-dependent hydrolase (beta-lactamase superfamily II)